MDKNKMIHINDMNERDPFILADKKTKTYYLYSGKPWEDHFNRKINVRESKDLIMWSEPQCAFKPEDDFWGKMDFWAPECHIWKGKYYLVSSFRNPGGYRRCAFLVSESPKGPFKPIYNSASTPEGWHCLDGTLYEDKKGKPWMVFCHEWTQVQDGQIAAVPMTDDLGKQAGEPIILFRGSDAPWKFTDPAMPWRFTQPQPAMGFARVTDGPFLHRMKNDELIMLWSSFSNTGYTVGYAKSLSGEIEGPWIQEKEPIFSQDGGHGMMFTTFESKLMLTVHSPNIIGREKLLIFEMQEQDGKLKTVNEITGNWRYNRYYSDGKDKGQGYPELNLETDDVVY